MNIKKSKNKLVIVLEKNDKDIDFVDFVISDDLIRKDLSFLNSNLDSWTYLVDTNQQKVFSFSDYHWDGFQELKKKGKVVLTAMSDDDAQDYLNEYMGE